MLKDTSAVGTIILEIFETSHRNPQNKWTSKVNPRLEATNQHIATNVLSPILKKINCRKWVVIYML